MNGRRILPDQQCGRGCRNDVSMTVTSNRSDVVGLSEYIVNSFLKCDTTTNYYASCRRRALETMDDVLRQRRVNCSQF